MQSQDLLRSPALVRRESLTDQTSQAIREAILDGTYALGQKLRESELAARFGVSSSVIREALHVLQGEGIIVTKPYCGRSVFSLRPEESAELTFMRASLESYAAYLAATKTNPAAAQAITSAALRFIASPPAAYTDWVERELGFHRAVWRASENEWLLRQLNQSSVPVFAFQIVATRARDFDVQTLWRNSVIRETPDNPHGHQALAAAIAAGDARKARNLMLLHILQRRDQIPADLFALPEELL